MPNVYGYNLTEGSGGGNIDTDSAKFLQAINYLDTSANGGSITSQGATENVNVSFNHTGDDSYDPSTNTVNWDPTSAASVLNDASGASYGVQSAALGLVHEIVHANDYANDPAKFNQDSDTPSDIYDDVEEQNAVTAEDRVANDLGETQRFNHEVAGTGQGSPPDGTVTESDPTEHTTTTADGSDVWVAGNNPTSLGNYADGSDPSSAPAPNADSTQNPTDDADNLAAQEADRGQNLDDSFDPNWDPTAPAPLNGYDPNNWPDPSDPQAAIPPSSDPTGSNPTRYTYDPAPTGAPNPDNPDPSDPDEPDPGDPDLYYPLRVPPPELPPSPPDFSDPLVLDLSGAGIELSGLSSSTAYFDFTNSGFRQHTGWTSAGMGLLVKNPADGATVTSQDLLGATSGNGFGDLATYDTNGDGVIDASDAGYSQLRVWIDSNSDGASGQGELYALASLGITSISVDSEPTQNTINGNEIVASGTFVVKGIDHTISEVNFPVNRQASIIPSEDGVTLTQDAISLPNLDGYGSMPDLWAAMSLNPDLAAAAQYLVFNAGALTADQFGAKFQDLVQMWAGASNVDPSSDGPYVDARHMAVIYAFYGIDPTSEPLYQTQPNWHNGPTVWEPLYQKIIGELEIRFASQITQSLANYGANSQYLISSPYLPLAGLYFDPTTDRFDGNLKNVLSMAIAMAPSDPDLASAYWNKLDGSKKPARIGVGGTRRR